MNKDDILLVLSMSLFPILLALLCLSKRVCYRDLYKADKKPFQPVIDKLGMLLCLLAAGGVWYIIISGIHGLLKGVLSNGAINMIAVICAMGSLVGYFKCVSLLRKMTEQRIQKEIELEISRLTQLLPTLTKSKRQDALAGLGMYHLYYKWGFKSYEQYRGHCIFEGLGQNIKNL